MSTIHFVELDTVTDQLAAATALREAHYQELATDKKLMVLDPAVEIYRRIEAAGNLFVLMAYDGDEMIGYSVNILATNLHYAGLLMCQNDVLYITPSRRAGRTGIRLMDETERVAAKRGARMMLWHAKEQTALARILPRRGCKVQDILYSKELQQSNFRMYGTFDVGQARDEALVSDMWDLFTARQDTPGSAHHDTRSIILRGPACEVLTNDIVFNMIECIDTPAIEWLPATRDLCATACARLGVKELGRVMLVELAPGGHIDLHVDEGAYAAHYDRFHLPLQSDAGNWFMNGPEQLHMKPGELWQFDQHTEHEVFNKSTTPRIHLIIDATRE